MTPDARRAARTIERIISAIGALLLLAFIVTMLAGEADWLGWIAMGLIVTLGLREFLIGSENVAARIKVKGGKDGLDLEADSEVRE